VVFEKQSASPLPDPGGGSLDLMDLKYFFQKSLPVVIAGVVALSACRVSYGGESKTAPALADQIVGTINSESVSAGEYRLIMERKASEAFSYMSVHYNLEDHPGYWAENSKPDSPLAKLREMVRDELVRIKVYQGEGKARGLIKDTSFANFLSEFERENTRRLEAKRLGQVVYGPRQYGMTPYYYILFGDLAYKVTQAVAKELESKVPESEIRECYEERKATFKGKPLEEMRNGIVTYLATRAAEKKLDALCASAKVEIKESSLRGIVPRVD